MKRIAVVCARASIKIADVALNFVVLVALLVLMTVGVYGLWDNKEIESEGTAVTWQAYKPEAQGEDLGFDELRKINPEVQAWLTLYGTNIDYPVVYSDNEWKYLNRNPKGEHALAGSLFFDSQTLPNLSSFPTVIYCNHMSHNAMFGQLDDYKNHTFFEE
ncbi:MAG: class B sortase, partial [Actinomycetaceae bacterium]|nr:class B sortase [Actinomycetaceae bacterium]